MKFYRLIKPEWAKETLGNGDPNPNYIETIDGDNTIEGANFAPEFIKEQNELGYNIYWFPNHPSKDIYSEGARYLNGRSVDVFDFVFVDMDLKDEVYKTKEEFYEKLKEFKLKPTMVVDSGNGVHAYWKVEDLTREAYVAMQFCLINYFDTDKSVWTVLQLMRLPGSKNTKKHGKPKVAKAIAELSSGKSYKLKDFPKEDLTITPEQKIKAQNHINKLDGKMNVALGEDVNLDELPHWFDEWLEKKPKAKELFEDPQSYGDRSAADMKLANMLFSAQKDRQDAVLIISNTQKALEKGIHRKDYAEATVGKVYESRTKSKFKTVGEQLRDTRSVKKATAVNGPGYMDRDVLMKPWRRKQLLGVIAGPGVGKTAMALNILHEIINNNPDSSDVYVFFTLEMPASEIVERWVALVGTSSPLTERLYVIENEDEEGNPRPIGLQEIYSDVKDIKNSTGRHVGAIIIDHLHLISTHQDATKTPTFGLKSDQFSGYGDVQKISREILTNELKSLVKSLDTFGIVLTQTTKAKGVGDLPLFKDACHGISNYDWIMDRIITIWQPLMRLKHKTDMRILAWQYAKLRQEDKHDKVKPLEPKLLTYDADSGRLRTTTREEYAEFNELLPQAREERKRATEREGTEYSIQIDLQGIEEALKRI